VREKSPHSPAPFGRKGKTLGCVAKIGWSAARDFRTFSNWYGAFAKIRTEFAGGG